MSSNDNYMHPRDRELHDLIEAGRLRAKAGFLWAEKMVLGQVYDVEGFGPVVGSSTQSGLLLVSNKSQGDETIRTKLLIVRVLGPDPEVWSFRDSNNLGERDWVTTWSEQKVGVGTVIAIRAVAGVEQDKEDRYIQVRYDELCAIGQPDDGTEFDMLPAPGWVMLDIGLGGRSETMTSGLFVRPELQDVLEDGTGCLKWGRVVALPAGYSDGVLTPGQDAGFDRYRVMEYMDAGPYRFVPQDEILVMRACVLC